ncbi:MAG: S9 family peptidase [Pseudomonadota bacterium]
MPIAAFIPDSLFLRPSLSPDGRLLAVIVDVKDGDRIVPTLSVFEVPELKLVARMRMPVNEVAIEHAWVDNRRLVISNGLEVGRHEAPFATGVIFATDVDGSNQKFLFGPRSSRGEGEVHRLPDRPDGRFYLRQDRREDRQWRSVLFEVDSRTAELKRLATLPLPGQAFVLKHDGQVGVAFGSDEKNDRVVFRRPTDPEPTASPALTPDEFALPFAYSPDDSALYGQLAKAGGPRMLMREGVDGSARTVMARDDIGNIDIVLWGPPPSQPFAAATRVGIPTLRYFADDRSEAQLHRALAAQFPGSFVEFLGFSGDGGRLLFRVGSDRDPGTFYLWERATGKAHQLFSMMSGIDPDRMGERRPIALQARDGLELRGYLTLPPGREPRGLPLVLLPHGGPHGVADEWFFDPDAQFLASRGYAVLQLNFRGSSGRGEKFREAGYRQWGDKVQDDLIDAVEWAGRSGMVDSDRVCVFGASFGAYSAMLTAAKAPTAFKCAVGLAGLYDLAMWFNEDRFIFDPKSKALMTRYFGDDVKEQRRISPTQAASRIDVPVLLIHGDTDSTTPFAQGKAMRDALRAAKKDVEWVDVSGEGHGFYARKNQEDLYRRLEAFLAKHIGK